MLQLALALRHLRPARAGFRVIPPRIRRLSVVLDESRLIALCREVAARDDSLAMELVPFLSFRVAKQHLPLLALFSPAWSEPLGDGDLTGALSATLDRWRAAQVRGSVREARRCMRLAAAYLRMAGVAAGNLLWQADGDGLAASDHALATQAVTP